MIPMRFKEWLSEAVVSRQKIFIDEADIAYLKQFRLADWSSALFQRYGKLIYDATDHGELRPDWNDEQVITIKIARATRQYTVNTGMKALIQKLKSLGYDLSGTNSFSKTSLYYKPMKMDVATTTIKKLLETIPEEHKTQLQNTPKSLLHKVINPQPNVVGFTPNYLMTRRNDVEPGVEANASLHDEFEKMQPQIMDVIGTAIKRLESLRHPNATYWLQNHEKLSDLLFDYVRLNWNDKQFRDMNRLFVMVQNKIKTYLQSGVISRRHHQELMQRGLNVHDLFSRVNPSTGQNWTMDDVSGVLGKTPNHDERYRMFAAQFQPSRIA